MKTNPILIHSNSLCILWIYRQYSFSLCDSHSFFSTLYMICGQWMYTQFYFNIKYALCVLLSGAKSISFVSQFFCILNISYLKFCHSANQMNNYYHHLSYSINNILCTVCQTCFQKYTYIKRIFCLLISMLYLSNWKIDVSVNTFLYNVVKWSRILKKCYRKRGKRSTLSSGI